MTDLVKARTEGRVRILTLNRPDARNALNAAIRQELISCLDEAKNDAGIGAIVLTGEGTAFAAGADLKELQARSSDEQKHFLQPPHIYSVIEALPKPVIAAVNGHALGAGLELATACDVRIASDKAKLGQPEINLALIPGGGGTQRLARITGPGAATKLVMTGDAIDATEALRLKLVDEVVAAEKVVTRAVELASLMAAKDPIAIAAAKATLRAAQEVPYAAGLVFETQQFVRLHARPESKDKVKQFLEKAK
jgi:enoyl-CoA hydratase